VVWLEVGVLVAAGLVLILTVPRLPARASLALLLSIIGAVVVLGFVLYLKGRLLFDAASPSLALGVLFASTLLITLADAESQRRTLRRQIQQQREAAARVAGELDAARRIQMGSLPDPAAAFPGETRFNVYAFLEPALEVGGDLYDFFPLDRDRVLFLIGDVSGKGLPGGLFMAVSKALYRSAALRHTGQVARVMREAEAEIAHNNAEGFFVTVLAGILDARTGDLEYCNAGHEPGYLLPRQDRPLIRLADGGGPPLCAVDGFPYVAGSLRLEPGDTLCLVTDGVYGRKRLEALLGTLGGAVSATVVGEAVRRDVGQFIGGAAPSDDMALLVLRWSGPEPTGR
jgi:adenylate cyclase